MFDLIDWKKAPVGQPTPQLPEVFKGFRMATRSDATSYCVGGA